MRFKAMIWVCAFLLAFGAQAQDHDFPTLAALASLDVPAFDFVDMASRMSTLDANPAPPAEPPQYSIGDRRTLNLYFSRDGEYEPTPMELRGMSDGVLVWVQADADYPNWRAEAQAQRLETHVLKPMLARFGYAEPPGIDGDPRMIIAMINAPELTSSGYFSRVFARPRFLSEESNELEMLVVNLKRDDEYDFFDEILIDFAAHEYLHVLHYHADPGEETWLNEALASYSAFMASQPFLSRSTGHSIADLFLDSPDTGLTQWHSVEDKGPKYGAGFLFVMYLTERFGDEIAARLLVEPADGWRSVVAVLRQFTDASAEEVFADWVLANYFLSARRGYGYRALDAELTRPAPVAALGDSPAAYDGELPQYATDYITYDVRGGDKLSLRLLQAPEAQLVPTTAPDGDFFAYALPSDRGHNRLTRAFTLDSASEVWLEVRMWQDLSEFEYAFVTISDDGGDSWQTLRGSYSQPSGIHQDYYEHGYSGTVPYWRNESFDLTAYAPGEILLSFELVSPVGSSYGGWALDDIRIRALDFGESFESPANAWFVEGWMRSDNRLPNNTWLQVAQTTESGLELKRELITGAGEMTVDLLPGVERAHIAVSPVVPQTALATEYTLRLSLLDAEGRAMTLERDCEATTTDALNIRDAPAGDKLGLLRPGASISALARDGDWLSFYYAGAPAWIHSGYVTLEGDCP